MKILTIHSDFIEFEPLSKAIKTAEEIEREKKRIEECLVVFTSVEEGDTMEVAEKTKQEIVSVAQQVKTNRIVIYPFVHLSSKPAKPSTALPILKELENIQGYEVIRAPFGWYKTFNVKCKGHPLSELSREIKASEKPAPGVIDERRESFSEHSDRYMILTPDGKEYEIDKYIFKPEEEEFRIMVEKEGAKKGLKTEDKEPEYISICKKYGIAWEPMSDSGHMRYAPNGAFIFDLVADYSYQTLKDLGIPIMPVKGTCMFNLEEKAVSEHAKLFGDRLYSLQVENDEFVLRYAACHQQFAMIKDWVISHKQIPFGAFEIADSYRLEQSGETLLCFRLRRFFMPDLHVFCKDETEAKEWFSKLHLKIFSEVERLNRDYEMLFNFSSEDYYKQNKEWILSLLKAKGKPALLHFYPPGKNYYWTVNIEYMIIDAMKRPREIGTVQIDTGNAKRFEITYTRPDGKKEYPAILHTAVIGGIERYIYMLFDTALKKKSETGRIEIPLWINPEQVRLLTVNERHLPRAKEIASVMERNNIRVGIDDRNESIAKKVREANTDWVGYVIVIGDKEMNSEELSAYVRSQNQSRIMTVDDIIKDIRRQTEGMPFRPMYIPREMTKRPII